MIHDVIITINPISYTAKFIFFGVRINKTQQIRCRKISRSVHSVVVYQKISNSVGRNDNFLAKARKLLIVPTSLDILDI